MRIHHVEIFALSVVILCLIPHRSRADSVQLGVGAGIDQPEFAGGTSSDCNTNGIPDEDELSQEVIHYDASLGVLPSAANPTWNNLGGFPGTINGDGRLVVNDTSATLLAYYERPSAFQTPTQSAICEFTGRAISGFRPTGQPIVWSTGFADGVKVMQLTVLVGRVGFLATANNFLPGCSADLPTSDTLHTYRVVKHGQSHVDVYADGNLLFSCPYANLAAAPVNRMVLLSTSSIGQSNFEYASLRYTIGSISLDSADCNTNGIPDACDLAAGTAQDCNGDGVPDDCQLEADDCNTNGVVDACELDFSFSLLETDFEGGLPQGWTADSLWHVSDQCVQPGAPDPTRWAYFGLDGSCHFNTGGAVAGAMVAPSFNIPANAVSASLSYASIYDGDRGSAAIPQGFDRAWVQVNGQVVDDVGPTPALGVWEDRQIDLSPFIGQTVAISWNFNSIDAISNSRLGWQVDAISLVAVTNNDCNTNGVPDDCEDCNGNSFADECDLLAGTSADCDSNGVPDDCDVLDSDCNSNGIPDACEPDSDDDGTPDGCDPDLDGDGVPNQIDVCQSSPANQAVNPLGGPMGDIDDDCAVTLIDYYYFDICLFLSGPGGDPVFQDCRDVFDFDGDGDVDLCDFAGLQQSILAEG